VTPSDAYAARTSSAIPPRYTGKERDTESGNDYMFARYYNSATGRFLSPDWSAKEEPVPYAKLDNPQTLNLYEYVGNNPVGRADADGHQGPPGEEDADDSPEMREEAREENALQPVAPAPAPLPPVDPKYEAARDAFFEPPSIKAIEKADQPIGGQPKAGVYEFPDAKEPGKTYVGQSQDMPARAGQHVASGKLAPGETVEMTEVPGGKTARELAERKRIDELGGTRKKPGSKTSNVRNPVSDKRLEKLNGQSQNGQSQ